MPLETRFVPIEFGVSSLLYQEIRRSTMVHRDIYKEGVDFAVLALQSPAFNKQ